tara:strand:+ start:1090 stop:1335 length:246 start_codon:yes stop_codon:yes gene_type:complete
MTSFKIGDKIRSYDFKPMPGRGDCYMDGVVTQVSNGLITFTCTRQVFDGIDVSEHSGSIDADVQTPAKFMMDWDGRLEVIK